MTGRGLHFASAAAAAAADLFLLLVLSAAPGMASASQDRVLPEEVLETFAGFVAFGDESEGDVEVLLESQQEDSEDDGLELDDIELVDQLAASDSELEGTAQQLNTLQGLVSSCSSSSAGSPTNACFSANAMQEIMLKEEQAIRKENAKLRALHEKLITNSACALPLVRLSLSLSGSPAQPFPPPPPVPLQTPPSRLATSPSAADATGR